MITLHFLVPLIPFQPGSVHVLSVLLDVPVKQLCWKSFMADNMVLIEEGLVVLLVQCHVFLFRLMQKNSKCLQVSNNFAEKI